MNLQPDRLFREKLENLQRPVSAKAWLRVESKLGKKNSKLFFLKVAAGFLLLISFSALFRPSGTLVTSPEITSNDGNLRSTQPESRTAADDKSEAVAKAEVDGVAAGKRTPSLKAGQSGDRRHATMAVTELALGIVQRPRTSLVEWKKPSLPARRASATVETNDSRITIVYSSKEVNEKFLDRNAMAQATSGEKKSSTLKKLLDRVNDLKHNQDPFGDLRQKKNEILALGFIKEKQRGQNK